MAFNNSNLSVLAYANGFSLFNYTSSSDDLDTIKTSGYFNDASSYIKTGDMILLSSIGENASADIAYVSSNTQGIVSIASIITAAA